MYGMLYKNLRRSFGEWINGTVFQGNCGLKSARFENSITFENIGSSLPHLFIERHFSDTNFFFAMFIKNISFVSLWSSHQSVFKIFYRFFYIKIFALVMLVSETDYNLYCFLRLIRVKLSCK